jgi:hypothetical protein
MEKILSFEEGMKLFDIIYDEQSSSDQDFMILVGGREGCLSGDTIIRTNRNSLGRPYSIKYLYNQFHGIIKGIQGARRWDLTRTTFVRSYTGNRIMLHKIKDVVYSGKKELCKVTLADGKTIKATSDHRIMTAEGWIETKNIVGKMVMLDSPHAKGRGLVKHKYHDIQIGGLIYHPYGHKRIEIHRLIFEANLNNIPFTEYISVVSNDEIKAKALSYVDPVIYVVHHRDLNHYNNNIENLEKLTISDHMKLHAVDAYKHFNQGNPEFSEAKSLESVGIEDTYDIICEDPHHNFSANDIIVHNSGKSTFVLDTIDYMDNKKGYNTPIQNIVFSIREFARSLIAAHKGAILSLDEGKELSADSWQSKEQKEFKKAITKIRKAGHLYFVCFPNPLSMTGYVKSDKAFAIVIVGRKGLASVYSKETFSKIVEKMKVPSIMAILKEKPNYRMEFPDYHGPLRAAYDNKKDQAIIDAKLEFGAALGVGKEEEVSVETIEDPDLIYATEAAKILNISSCQVNKLAIKGKIAVSKMNFSGRRLFSKKYIVDLSKSVQMLKNL